MITLSVASFLLVSCQAYFSHTEGKKSLVNGLFRLCFVRFKNWWHVVFQNVLGHYKLDNSFPSTARMPFKSPPNIFIIVVIFYYNELWRYLFKIIGASLSEPRGVKPEERRRLELTQLQTMTDKDMQAGHRQYKSRTE